MMMSFTGFRTTDFICYSTIPKLSKHFGKIVMDFKFY